MFVRTYNIRKQGPFTYFESKAVDFEANISLALIGVQDPARDHRTSILGLEYEGRIFPFAVQGLSLTDVEHNYIKAGDISISVVSQSIEQKDLFVSKEKLVFEYDSLEQYERIIALMRKALNVLAYHYGQMFWFPTRPLFFYNISCVGVPPNLQPKELQNENEVRSFGEAIWGAGNDPNELSLSQLEHLTNKPDSWERRFFQPKMIKEFKKRHKERVDQFDGERKVLEAKEKKGEEVRKLLVTRVERTITPLHHKGIKDYFAEIIEHNKIITLEQAMAKLINLVAIGAEKCHHNGNIELNKEICITSLPVLNVLKKCYEKEYASSDGFDVFFALLFLQLEKEANMGNFFRTNHQNEFREKHRKKRNRENRYKFWKDLM